MVDKPVIAEISNGETRSYSFSLFPNPVSSVGCFQMEFPDKSNHLEMNVYNSKGTLVLTFSLENIK